MFNVTALLLLDDAFKRTAIDVSDHAYGAIDDGVRTLCLSSEAADGKDIAKLAEIDISSQEVTGATASRDLRW